MSPTSTPAAGTVTLVDFVARAARSVSPADSRAVVLGAFDTEAPIARYSICIRVDGTDGDLAA